MALRCRLFGHRPSRAISGETGDLRSRCTRCGAGLVMYGPRDWRCVEVARSRFSLRVVLARARQRLNCRLNRHRPAADFGRWVNDPFGEGYHVGHCRHCKAVLAKPPGQEWRAMPESARG
jgi:hypothetical protein